MYSICYSNILVSETRCSAWSKLHEKCVVKAMSTDHFLVVVSLNKQWVELDVRVNYSVEVGLRKCRGVVTFQNQLIVLLKSAVAGSHPGHDCVVTSQPHYPSACAPAPTLYGKYTVYNRIFTSLKVVQPKLGISVIVSE